MTPVIPQLDPLPQPAPSALLWFLLLLTFFLHVVAMNAVLGGSILALFVRRRTASEPHAKELSRIMSKGFPVAIAATVTLGVAALLFVQTLYGRLFFTSAVLMGWIWLSVVPLLIVAYYSAYAMAFRPASAARALPWTVAAIAVGVAFIYTNNMSLMLRPETFRDLYLASGRGLHTNLGDRMLLPRFLHMVTGAIAVAALLIAVVGATRHSRDTAFGSWAIGRGARWCMMATTVNIAVGVWFLGMLPVPLVLLLIGRSPLATVALLAGIVGGVASAGLLMIAAKSSKPFPVVLSAAGAMGLALVLMLIVRDFVRQQMLEASGFARQEWVVTDWGPIAIFAVLLVGALALVAWMVSALVSAPAAHPGRLEV